MPIIIAKKLLSHSLLLCALLLILTNNAYAQSNLEKLTFVLPIDESLKQGEQLWLSIKIPEDFNALQPLDQITKSGVAEFISKEDKDPKDWTRIFTISNMPAGSKILAKDLLADMKKKFHDADHSMKIMEESYAGYNGYDMGKLAMSYTPGKGRDEIVIMQYYCGTQECSGMQYATLLKPNEDKAAAFKKMSEFLEANKVLEVLTN